MEEKTVSGEEHHAMHERQSAQPSPPWFKQQPVVFAVITLLGLLVFAGGWIGGTQYQKQVDSTLPGGNSASQSLAGNGGMGTVICTNSGPCTGAGTGGAVACTGSGPCVQTAGGGGAPVSGTVTAVSAAAITIRTNPGGNVQTFSITASTQESSGPGAAPSSFRASDIHLGDSIAIVPTTSGGSQAQLILIGVPIA